MGAKKTFFSHTQKNFYLKLIFFLTYFLFIDNNKSRIKTKIKRKKIENILLLFRNVFVFVVRMKRVAAYLLN